MSPMSEAQSAALEAEALHVALELKAVARALELEAAARALELAGRQGPKSKHQTGFGWEGGA